MAVRLALTLLVALLCGAATAIEHKLTWDRFWLRNNLQDNTINVELGDTIILLCRVESDVEADEDLIENVVLLENEEQLDNCDSGTKPSRSLGECAASGFDNMVHVTDSPTLATQPSFAEGEVYYFTSFSDGTLDSAQKDVTKGGACASSPPLKLTVSVSATSTSMVAPTSTTSTTSSIKSSTTVIKSTSLTPAVTLLPTPDGVVGDPEDNGAGQLVSLNFIILLILSSLVSCFIL